MIIRIWLELIAQEHVIIKRCSTTDSGILTRKRPVDIVLMLNLKGQAAGSGTQDMDFFFYWRWETRRWGEVEVGMGDMKLGSLEWARGFELCSQGPIAVLDPIHGLAPVLTYCRAAFALLPSYVPSIHFSLG